MKIGNKNIDIPLIQGGMGVGVSLGRLAGSVAGCGAIGVISTAGIGFKQEGFWGNLPEANILGLKEEIRKAKEISKGIGMVAINAMVATTDYAKSVSCAIKSGIDCIISGAGLPLDLPKLAEGSDVALAPIVSSAKAAGTICKAWDQRYSVVPDFIVVEGCEAGGHLGFKKDDLINGTAQTLDVIIKEVVNIIKPYEDKHSKKIPVFAAGGIYTADDVEHIMNCGADGVQIGTRFIATQECDASPEYKQMFIDSQNEDIMLVPSPAGLPGRAFNTPLMKKLAMEGRVQPKRCAGCLKTCKVDTTPYCIMNALIEAVKGNYNDGLFFTGSNGYRIEKITTVNELISELFPATITGNHVARN